MAPGRFMGTALTCWCGPNDNLALMAAVSLAEAGDVVVAATEGFAGSGMAGDLLVGMARNRGVVGLVADGMVRDRDAIVTLGLPVFCRGAANSCVRSGPGTVGLPLVVGGVAVASGDLLVGDADGVVVVPREQLTQVGQRLADVARAEREAEAAVQAGQTELPAIATLLASDRVRWVDANSVEAVGADGRAAIECPQLGLAAAGGDLVQDRHPFGIGVGQLGDRPVAAVHRPFESEALEHVLDIGRSCSRRQCA